MANSLLLIWPSFTVNLDMVHAYFKQNLSSNYDGLVGTVQNLMVVFKEDFSDTDSNSVSSYWSSITSQTFQPTLDQVIEQRIFANQQFGQNLVLQIEKDNVKAGLTVEQITGQLQDYALLLSMLNSGSIPTALAQAQSLQPLDGMTQDRINGYVAQIKSYLGVS